MSLFSTDQSKNVGAENPIFLTTCEISSMFSFLHNINKVKVNHSGLWYQLSPSFKITVLFFQD